MTKIENIKEFIEIVNESEEPVEFCFKYNVGAKSSKNIMYLWEGAYSLDHEDDRPEEVIDLDHLKEWLESNINYLYIY